MGSGSLSDFAGLGRGFKSMGSDVSLGFKASVMVSVIGGCSGCLDSSFVDSWDSLWSVSVSFGLFSIFVSGFGVVGSLTLVS